jgi:hypothetical protein
MAQVLLTLQAADRSGPCTLRGHGLEGPWGPWGSESPRHQDRLWPRDNTEESLLPSHPRRLGPPSPSWSIPSWRYAVTARWHTLRKLSHHVVDASSQSRRHSSARTEPLPVDYGHFTGLGQGARAEAPVRHSESTPPPGGLRAADRSVQRREQLTD